MRETEINGCREAERRRHGETDGERRRKRRGRRRSLKHTDRQSGERQVNKVDIEGP